MALRYLLDTNILSDLIRSPQGVIADRIADVGEDAICTSIIVAGEPVAPDQRLVDRGTPGFFQVLLVIDTDRLGDRFLVQG